MAFSYLVIIKSMTHTHTPFKNLRVLNPIIFFFEHMSWIYYDCSLSLKRVYLYRKLIILNEKNKSALNG